MEEKIIVKLEADIADLKTQLGAAEAELKRFGLGVETSINAITLDRLNAQLKQLQTQLGATDIGSQAFQNIGKEITILEGQINGALTPAARKAKPSSNKAVPSQSAPAATAAFATGIKPWPYASALTTAKT